MSQSSYLSRGVLVSYGGCRGLPLFGGVVMPAVLRSQAAEEDVLHELAKCSLVNFSAALVPSRCPADRANQQQRHQFRVTGDNAAVCLASFYDGRKREFVATLSDSDRLPGFIRDSDDFLVMNVS